MAEYQRIGEILVRQGKISREQLEEALRLRHSSRRRLGEILTDLGFASERDVAEGLAEQFGFKVVDPDKIQAHPEALRLLDSQVALAHRILPVKLTEDCIECVMADPIDFPTSDMISKLARKRVVVHVAPASALVESIRRAYGLTATVPAVNKRKEPAHSAPKPQKDREAILSLWDSGGRKTGGWAGVNLAAREDGSTI